MCAGLKVLIDSYRINSETQGKPSEIENKNRKNMLLEYENKKKMYKVDTSTIGNAKQTKEKQSKSCRLYRKTKANFRKE